MGTLLAGILAGSAGGFRLAFEVGKRYGFLGVVVLVGVFYLTRWYITRASASKETFVDEDPDVVNRRELQREGPPRFNG